MKTPVQIQEWFKKNYNIEIELLKNEDIFLEQNLIEEEVALDVDPYKDNFKFDISQLKKLGPKAATATMRFFKWYYSTEEVKKSVPTIEERLREHDMRNKK